ncbi:MAG: YecA family protein [Spirochaetota bacterium]
MKPGRNDPCPCGSGKKYKYCCLENDNRDRKTDDGLPPIHNLMGFSSAVEYTDAIQRYTDYCEKRLPPGAPAPTFREYSFGTSEAGGVFEDMDLERVLDGVSNLDEARDRIDEAVKRYNAELDQGETLSIEDKLTELLDKGPMRAKNVVTLNKKISADAVKEVPVIRYMEAFLEFMVRNNGTLSLDENRELKADLDELFTIIREQTEYDCLTIDSSGGPFFPVQMIFIKACLIELGFIEPNERGLTINEKGLNFLAGKGRKQVFFRVLRIMTDRINWFYLSGLPEEVEVFHETRGLILHAAACMPKEYSSRIRPKDLLDAVDSLVPIYEELKKAGIGRKEAADIFTDHFFLLYCHFFNFMVIEESDKKGRPVSFSRTKLLEELFHWEL